MKLRLPLVVVLSFLFCAFSVPVPVLAQASQNSSPSSALASALSAACQSDVADFARYLTAANSAAFLALPHEEQVAFLKRFSLADEPGRPLLSSDNHSLPVLRCMANEGTSEFRFGNTRIEDNLSFIPVTVVDGRDTEFGLVREKGRWRLLSVGLVLLDVPQLSKQWAQDALAAREASAVANLRNLASAIDSYRLAYGKLPDALAQLGPAPPNQISPQQASLIDKQLAAGSDGNYVFRYRLISSPHGNAPAFEIVAVPRDYGKTGRRSFLLDSSGAIHAADHQGSLATSADPIIGASSSSQ